MRRERSTKILATLGPASASLQGIKSLFQAGADVFRLNFSHGSHDDHRRNVEMIRAIEKELDRPIGIVQDLQGPKFRIGEFISGSIELPVGAPFQLDLSTEFGNVHRAPLPHPELFGAVKPGCDLLLDDGKVRLRVKKTAADIIETEVIYGGVLSAHKGVNLPNVELPLSALSAKDKDDLEFGIDLQVDWIALSFVQRPDDVIEARHLTGNHAKIMVKVEKPQALKHLDAILEHADALMVARGDLGVELPPEQVPAIQKRIIRHSRRMGKPVIVATQMLDSMINAPSPTRAEASDVATAVYDGADAVMLSGETATGKFPIAAVDMMNRIISSVEHDPAYRRIMDADHMLPEHTSADAITAAAQRVAHTLDGSAIATYTTSGSTALRAARERPSVPILGLTPDLHTARLLALVWGVHSVHCADATDPEDMVRKARKAAYDAGIISDHSHPLVITAGVPFGTPGATNLLRIA